ncbi:MAG TPA: ribosome biogenesis GTP-binding protein YihA/YsxC [Burkholderiales bacterium]|jgi:GTP-binding protein|nr:ribosome biogenesis GTP-binding protein YihA/YsxC [Burkholderiales bacterium]
MSRTRLFNDIAFFATAAHERDLPASSGVEIAFAGRSNSGKSSALNALARRHRLAFVSKTPGRTQQINFFSLGAGRFLVDLPGYGYAQVPGTMKQHWQELLSGYLQTRGQLRGLVLLMDARHPLTPLDRQLLDWFAPTGRPVHVLLTKTDKLSKQEANRQLRSVSASLAARYQGCSVQLFSATTQQGVDEAETLLARWFDAGRAEMETANTE